MDPTPDMINEIDKRAQELKEVTLVCRCVLLALAIVVGAPALTCAHRDALRANTDSATDAEYWRGRHNECRSQLAQPEPAAEPHSWVGQNGAVQ